MTSCLLNVSQCLSCLLIILSIAERGWSIRMDDTGPISVQNGSLAGVLLDCPFDLEGASEEDGLVVKWYYNGINLIYQWIWGHETQALGHFRERIDPNYEASEDVLFKQRAIAIIVPTVELTGIYTCSVSTFNSYNNLNVTLTVYSPASDFYMDWYNDPSEDSVIISCKAEGLYPEPQISIYRHIQEIDTLKEEEELDIEVELNDENNTYSITAQKEFTSGELDPQNYFSCSLSIPQTDYQENQDLSYDKEPTTTPPPPSTTTTTTTLPTHPPTLPPTLPPRAIDEEDDPTHTNNNELEIEAEEEQELQVYYSATVGSRGFKVGGNICLLILGFIFIFNTPIRLIR